MKPAYIRWMIKAALAYLVVGMGLGLAMFLALRVPAFRWALAWRSTHVHLLLVGVVIQMIMGVALWMFPRLPDPPHLTPEREGWRVCWWLNAGILLRVAGEPFWTVSDIWYGVAFAGMALQFLAIGYFVYLIVGRVRAVGPSSPSQGAPSIAIRPPEKPG